MSKKSVLINGIMRTIEDDIDYDNYSKVRSDKDAEGIFITIEFFDDQATPVLRKKSVLSGGTSPKYTTRTVTFYDESGSLIDTLVYTLTYDVDDELLKEELQ